MERYLSLESMTRKEAVASIEGAISQQAQFLAVTTEMYSNFEKMTFEQLKFAERDLAFRIEALGILHLQRVNFGLFGVTNERPSNLEVMKRYTYKVLESSMIGCHFMPFETETTKLIVPNETTYFSTNTHIWKDHRAIILPYSEKMFDLVIEMSIWGVEQFGDIDTANAVINYQRKKGRLGESIFMDRSR